MLMLFPVRGLSLLLWGMLLTKIEAFNGKLTLESIQGLARRYPMFSFALVLVQFSVAGMPLLGEFPIKLSLLTTAYASSPAIGIWAFIGSLGLLLFSLRLLLSLVTPDKDEPYQKWVRRERLTEYLPILIMILILPAHWDIPSRPSFQYYQGARCFLGNCSKVTPALSSRTIGMGQRSILPLFFVYNSYCKRQKQSPRPETGPFLTPNNR